MITSFFSSAFPVKACNEDIDGAINNNIIKTKNLIDKVKNFKIKFYFCKLSGNL